MSKEKSKRNDLQSDDREIPSKASVPLKEPRIMSFDVYFVKMKAQNPKIHEHHKVPMKRFAERKGCLEATEEQFEKIFRSY
jgi:hypothetical protein